MRSKGCHGNPGTIKWQPPRVIEVREGSPCEGKVQVGDLVLEIDGRAPLDILDYLQASEAGKVSLRLLRDGREKSARARKERGEPLGLVFDEAVFDGVRTCRNKCLFCFIDQMPPGLRSTLYMRDDDYRLSFYFGNFITLNNLSNRDIARITRLRLSPLYVSLHTSDPSLRSQMMGGDASRGLEALKVLLGAGIEVHLQVVACPGVNDGRQLRQTFRDVLDFYPAASLGVVPVGITSGASQAGMGLKAHDRRSSREILDVVGEFQEEALERRGERVFFAADEFYIMADMDFPGAEGYEGYPQLENGVGMARKFIDEALECAQIIEKQAKGGRGIITGMAGETVIRKILAHITMRDVEVITAENRLFGPRVTVTSLLSGGDIVTGLKDSQAQSKEMLIPETLLRDERFLDDLTLDDVRNQTGVTLIPVAVDGAAFLGALADWERLD